MWPEPLSRSIVGIRVWSQSGGVRNIRRMHGVSRRSRWMIKIIFSDWMGKEESVDGIWRQWRYLNIHSFTNGMHIIYFYGRFSVHSASTSMFKDSREKNNNLNETPNILKGKLAKVHTDAEFRWSWSCDVEAAQAELSLNDQSILSPPLGCQYKQSLVFKPRSCRVTAQHKVLFFSAKKF